MSRKKDLEEYSEEYNEEYAEEYSEEYTEEDAQEEMEYEQEDEEAEYLDEKSERRVYRRKRRIRNQIISYIVMIAVIIGLGYAGYKGSGIIRKHFAKNKAEVTQQQEPEEEPQEVVEIPAPEEEEPEQVEEVQVNPADEVARYYIEKMTTEEKVAGLFFVTPESMMDGVSQAVLAGGKTQEALDKYAVGGIIYFDKNIQDAQQITDMIAGTRDMSHYPLFFGVDEEGGSVSRVAGSIDSIANVGNPSELGATYQATDAYNAYINIAGYLNSLGFNVDFAPVADIYDGNNKMFEKRSFGTDPDTVSAYTYQAIYGLQDAGISAVAKHFPGHGRCDADSHNGRTTLDVPLEEIIGYDALPFQNAIAAKVDFVMVGHISLPQVIGDYTPASMSSAIVTDVLRAQLGYDGIIITDAMNMGAITTYYGSAEAAIAAIKAGCDMILMPEDFKAAYQGVLEAVNNGEIPMERIEESLMRIYRVKCKGMTIADVQ